jgi:7,8-dihydropterin-6-yl-methyl-4-(beta-D-ribofuranosyl)aminobenzene 5'-phosphate synthase
MDAVGEVRITALVETQVDMLLPDEPGVKRFGLIDHFSPPHGKTILTENGAAFWIEIEDSGRTHRVLYDAGLTGDVTLHNAAALGLAVDELDTVVLSHAHPDHYRGLTTVLRAREKPVELAVSPDSFLPKILVNDDGDRVLQVNEGMTREALSKAGGRVVESHDESQLAPGLMLTGAIRRETPFEPPVPPRDGKAGLFIERDGGLELDDDAIDEQALVLNLRGRGLLVLTACGHAGIVNTIHEAQRISGVEQVMGLVGGFHFGFPGVPRDNAERALDALEEMELDLIAPMHCTGLWGQARVMERFPDAFVQNVTGTTLQLEG